MTKEVVCIHQQAFDQIRFQGVRIGRECVEHLARLILDDGRALPRDFVDCPPDDPRYELSAGYKQLATYGVVRHRGQILSYSRKPDHDRPELATLRSIGIGGHVEPSDIGPADSVDEVVEALYEAVGRELAEEVPGGSGVTIRIVGLVNDDARSTHHLGLLYVAEVETFEEADFAANFSDELIDPSLEDTGIAPPEGALEPWSEIVREALIRGQL